MDIDEAPAVYAIYVDDRLVYIGSTQYARRFGEHAMRELRLLRRLRPVGNTLIPPFSEGGR